MQLKRKAKLSAVIGLTTKQAVSIRWLLGHFLSVDSVCTDHFVSFDMSCGEERSDSVVECLIRDRRVVGSSLTGGTTLRP